MRPISPRIVNMSLVTRKPPTACTVVSSADSKNYLRIVDGEAEPVTLPLTRAGLHHRNYILSTWLKSYIPVIRKWLGKDAPLRYEQEAAETLWEQTWIVTSEEDEFTIHAWVAGVPGVLHYVYVPPDLRGKGIARALIRHACGHTFSYGRPWPYKRNPSGGTYNPYLLGRNHPEPKGGS